VLADFGFDTARAPAATGGPLVPITPPESGASVFELMDAVAD
jgi:hypothetical protein